MKDEQRAEASVPEPSPAGYEPPRIEGVLTAEDLEREVQYAGLTSIR